MSLTIPSCPECAVACLCLYVAWTKPLELRNFGVAWGCPKCEFRTLVVSPAGPVSMTSTTCLHCSSSRVTMNRPCPDCGSPPMTDLTPSEIAHSDAELLALARKHFAAGTCRKGLTLINFVERRNPHCDEARKVRSEFLEHLDSQQPF